MAVSVTAAAVQRLAKDVTGHSSLSVILCALTVSTVGMLQRPDMPLGLLCLQLHHHMCTLMHHEPTLGQHDVAMS